MTFRSLSLALIALALLVLALPTTALADLATHRLILPDLRVQTRVHVKGACDAEAARRTVRVAERALRRCAGRSEGRSRYTVVLDGGKVQEVQGKGTHPGGVVRCTERRLVAQRWPAGKCQVEVQVTTAE